MFRQPTYFYNTWFDSYHDGSLAYLSATTDGIDYGPLLLSETTDVLPSLDVLYYFDSTLLPVSRKQNAIYLLELPYIRNT